jgi:hypothetical protein
MSEWMSELVSEWVNCVKFEWDIIESLEDLLHGWYQYRYPLCEIYSNGTLFAHAEAIFFAKNNPAMHNNPVKFQCNYEIRCDKKRKEEKEQKGKEVYHGSLECFIYVLICHVLVF